MSGTHFSSFGTQSLTASSDVSIQVQNSFAVPNRTLVLSGTQSNLLGDDLYSLTAIKRATPGDILEVNIEAPSSFDYQLELRDSDLNIELSRNGTGNATFTNVDTSGLTAGTYLLAVTENGDAVEVFPLVLSAYDATITSVPDQITTSDSLTVKATVQEAVTNPTALEDVMLAGFTTDDTDGVAYKMSNTGTNEYEATISEPPAGDYQFHVVPRSSNEVSFEILGFTLVLNSEFIGLSEAGTVTVELAAGDTLTENWSQASGALSSDVSGRLQFSDPAIDNENIYVSGLDEYVTAHSRNSGELRWQFERNGSLSDSAPVLNNGTVYVGDGAGQLHALNAPDGSKHWSYDTATETSGSASAITSTPAVLNDWVFFGSNSGTIHAVTDNGGSFTQEWAWDHAEAVYSELVAAQIGGDPWVFVTTTDGRVLVLDVNGVYTNQAGQRLIDFDESVDSFGASSPVIDNETLYVAGNNVTAIDVPETINQGNLNDLPITQVVSDWQYTSYGGTAGSNPTLSPDGNAVYVGSADGDVYAIVDNGNLDWRASTGDAVSSTPAVTDDRVIVGSLDGTVYVFDRATGLQMGSTSVGDPVRTGTGLLNNNAYIGTEAGDVLNLRNIP